MAEVGRHWEVAELVAALDPGIAPRLLARHPVRGRCLSCRCAAPCSSRTLAELALAAGAARRRSAG